MDILEPEPYVLTNRQGVVFCVTHLSRTVQCVIPVSVLETYFWLGCDPDEARILKIFHNGYGRIRAAAERKLLVCRTQHIHLRVSDFAPRTAGRAVFQRVDRRRSREPR